MDERSVQLGTTGSSMANTTHLYRRGLRGVVVRRSGGRHHHLVRDSMLH